VHAAAAAALVPGVGSSHGHVGAISSDIDATVSSGLGGTSGISDRQVEVAST
jgi:hypothetical protein